MTDSNFDIVPTLRMFNGLIMDQAADEIERLRNRIDMMTISSNSLFARAETAERQVASLRAQISQMEKDHREDLRTAAAQAAHHERFPDEPYGTY